MRGRVGIARRRFLVIAPRVVLVCYRVVVGRMRLWLGHLFLVSLESFSAATSYRI